MHNIAVVSNCTMICVQTSSCLASHFESLGALSTTSTIFLGIQWLMRPSLVSDILDHVTITFFSYHKSKARIRSDIVLVSDLRNRVIILSRCSSTLRTNVTASAQPFSWSLPSHFYLSKTIFSLWPGRMQTELLYRYCMPVSLHPCLGPETYHRSKAHTNS